MNKHQYKFMKMLNKVELISSKSLTENENEMCKYLQLNGYIMQEMIHQVEHYKVTQAGKSAMFDFKIKYYRWWVPVIVSALALLISITSLIISL